MSTATVPHPLLELRRRRKADQEEERTLSSELVGALPHGAGAVAILESRTILKVDPELFHHAVGLDDRRAYGAMTVSATAARRLLPEELLADISVTAVTPVLRVEPHLVAAVRVVAGL